MSNILNITSDDVALVQGKSGLLLSSGIEGISFVLFHADPGMCGNCDVVVPQIKQLSRHPTMNSCKFALCNLSRNSSIIKMARKTVTPFEYVPYMMLYYDGIPIARYDPDDGNFDINDCAEFLKDMIVRLQSKKNFIQTKNFKFDDDIKKFGGIPFNLICDEDKGVCYFKADDLYGKNGKKN